MIGLISMDISWRTWNRSYGCIHGEILILLSVGSGHTLVTSVSAHAMIILAAPEAGVEALMLWQDVGACLAVGADAGEDKSIRAISPNIFKIVSFRLALSVRSRLIIKPRRLVTLMDSTSSS